MDLKDRMDRIYGGRAPGDIPWNVAAPPALLVDLVDAGRIAPCDVADLGCGAGNTSAWLAGRGFRVTGIDLSPNAIALARRTAARRGVECRFLAADLLHDLPDLAGAFDLAFEWDVLHHVFPEHRPHWVANVHRLLRPGGRYLSVCFGEEDAEGFCGAGKYRQTPIGTTLYFSSEDELRALFDPLFEIEELRTVDVESRQRTHRAVMARMVRRT